MKLYEIANEFKSLEKLLDDCEIDQGVFSDTIAAIEMAFEDKARNCLMMLEQLKENESSIDSQIARLKLLKVSCQKNQESLKDYLIFNMENTGKEKMDLGLFKVTLRAASKSVSVLDESKIPTEFWRVIPESKAVDKAGLKEALKLGAIEGAELVDGKRSLLIK